jgi:redox-sensitive bicupin YhaK (pirin superfamily)
VVPVCARLTTLEVARTANFAHDGGEIVMTAKSDNHVAIFLGRPLNEPVLRHGPFAMTNQADVAKRSSTIKRGIFGSSTIEPTYV